jgi:hypothetical protein
MDTEKQENDQQFIQDILELWKKKDRRAGQLVQRREAVWHYSVALSHRKAISWSGIPHQTGHMNIHDIGDEFIDTVNVVYLPKDQVLKNLIASVVAFHNIWQYGWGWNCEHWARLITTGEPKSYQMETVLFGICNLLGLCYRPEAIPHLVGKVSSIDEVLLGKCQVPSVIHHQ